MKNPLCVKNQYSLTHILKITLTALKRPLFREKGQVLCRRPVDAVGRWNGEIQPGFPGKQIRVLNRGRRVKNLVDTRFFTPEVCDGAQTSI
jgi:hypothetical protein